MQAAFKSRLFSAPFIPNYLLLLTSGPLKELGNPENVLAVKSHTRNNNNNNSKIINEKLAEAAELTEDKSPYSKYTLANVLENTTSSCTGMAA
jgi:hypothetical protein